MLAHSEKTIIKRIMCVSGYFTDLQILYAPIIIDLYGQIDVFVPVFAPKMLQVTSV